MSEIEKETDVYVLTVQGLMDFINDNDIPKDIEVRIGEDYKETFSVSRLGLIVIGSKLDRGFDRKCLILEKGEL